MSTRLGWSVCQILAVFVGLGAVLVACTRVPVAFQNVGYNQGLEDSENKMLLLNAVRASKRYPMYFSASDSLSGQHSHEAGVTTSFPFKIGPALSTPFGRGAGNHIELQNFNVNPSANAKGGFSSHNMANLMTAEFVNAISTDVDAKRMKFFLDQGWPEELVYFMMIQEIGITHEVRDLLYLRNRQICEEKYFGPEYHPPKYYDEICKSLVELHFSGEERGCDMYRTDTIVPKDIKIRLFVLKNDPRNMCDYYRFALFVRMARLLKARIESDVKPLTDAKKFLTKRKIVKTRDFKNQTNKEEDEEYAYDRTELRTGSETTEIKEKAKATILTKVVMEIPGKGVTPYTFGGSASDSTPKGYMALRSPRDMLYYLGSLISVQLRKNNRYEPKILVDSNLAEVPLFKIQSGVVGKLVGAVSVKHEHMVYAIPRPGVGDIGEHRSMQALALVKQLISKGLKRDDLPQASTVIVGGG